MTKTQKNHLKKWIEALRSGKYRKTTGQLFEKGKKSCKFCAMGVACDVYMKANKKLGWHWSEDAYYGYQRLITNGPYTYETEAPPVVEEWLGIESQSDIIELNDEEDKSFKKIADYLEKKYFSKK